MSVLLLLLFVCDYTVAAAHAAWLPQPRLVPPLRELSLLGHVAAADKDLHALVSALAAAAVVPLLNSAALHLLNGRGRLYCKCSDCCWLCGINLLPEDKGLHAIVINLASCCYSKGLCFFMHPLCSVL
jgi:hypothetical protein